MAALLLHFSPFTQMQVTRLFTEMQAGPSTAAELPLPQEKEVSSCYMRKEGNNIDLGS